MTPLAIVFLSAVSLIVLFGSLRAAEIASGDRFFFGKIRVVADDVVENLIHKIWKKLVVIENSVLNFFRVLPHHLADFVAMVLRFTATKSLRLLRAIHERRGRGGVSRGSVSFFVNALGENTKQERGEGKVVSESILGSKTLGY